MTSQIPNLELVQYLERDIEHRYRRDNRLLRLHGAARLARPDLIVVTGDLADRGEPREYSDGKRHSRDVHGLLEELCNRFLGGRRDHIVLLPGNHDVSWSTFARLTKHTRSRTGGTVRVGRHRNKTVYYTVDPRDYRKRLRNVRHFLRDWYGRDDGFPEVVGYRVFDFVAPFGVVITAMSSVGDNDMYSRSGSIGNEVVNEAAAAVKEMRLDRSIVRIAAWHHGTFPSAQADDCVPRAQLAALGELGFHFGLHGHTHQDEFENACRQRPTQFPLVGAGTMAASRVDRPESVGFEYNLLRVTRGQLIVHTRQRLAPLAPWEPRFWALSTGYEPYYAIALQRV